MLTAFKVKDKWIGQGRRPYIIAEMACAHDGSYEKAIKLIDASVEAGADAVQLQFFNTDHVVTPNHEAFGLLKDIEFSESQWTDLTKYAQGKAIDVFVCTYDLPSVALASKLGIDGIKLNSADLGNPEVLAACAKTGIPITLGTGASTLEEIANGLKVIADNGGNKVVLMHGVQNFPTKTSDLNIERIELLRDTFGIPVGYHDHTSGDDPFTLAVDYIAVGMGAHVIEKHITIDRSEKGIDYQAALEPAEFKTLVSNIERATIAIGSKVPRAFTESDLRYRKFQKKSIVASKDLAPGSTISREDVLFIRNAVNGIPPYEFPEIQGATVVNPIKAFENIGRGDIKIEE